MRLCPGYLLFVVVVAVLALMTLLGGCGQKGDLYLPDENPPAQSD
ncbi:MAG: LPS translocon maturation chaperone LptM [Pseudomonadota bacterium]